MQSQSKELLLSDAVLQGLAAQALNLAKRDFEQGKFNFLLASYHESDGPRLHRMQKIEALIVERLGEDWLNNGRKKDIGFDMLRTATHILPPDAIVFVTAANRFESTAKLNALPDAQRIAMLNTNHDRHLQMVKEGLLEIHDGFSAIVQTPTRVCSYFQDFDRGEPVGKPITMFIPQADFDGRLKMYD